jgi:cell wall-associated NlpC family hydrolase
VRSDPSRPAGIAVMYLSSIRVAATAVLGVLLLLAAAAGASANPSIKDKRAQAEAILAEIHVLDEDVGAAAERYNGANYELQQLTAQLTETREDLTRARELRKISQQRVAARLVQLYVNGESGSALEVILGAQSLDEILDRIDLAQRVAAQDARIAREATALRERVAKREKQLTAARERQAVVVEQRAAEKRAIEGKLAERQRLLASVKDEIARLEEAERRRQAELQRKAQLELERQQRLAEAQQRAQAQAEQAAVAPTDSSGDGNDGDGLSGPAPGVDYTPPPADAGKGAQVVAIAMQYLGIPYVWGGASPSGGFDCSGLTMYVFAQVGVSLPHYAAAQYQMGSPVSKDQLQSGDLVFFRGLGHMGMYIGGGNFIHAPHTGDVVKISPLSDPYYVANWVGARRVL